MRRYQLVVHELLDDPVPTHGSVRGEVLGALRISSREPLTLLDVLQAGALEQPIPYVAGEASP